MDSFGVVEDRHLDGFPTQSLAPTSVGHWASNPSSSQRRHFPDIEMGIRCGGVSRFSDQSIWKFMAKMLSTLGGLSTYIYIYIEWANALVPPTPFQGRPGHYSGTPCQCQCHGWEGCPTNRFCLYNWTYPSLLVVKVWQKQTITTPWTVNAQDKVGTGSGNDWNKVGLLGVVIINHHLSRSVGTNVGCFPCLCPWFWNSLGGVWSQNRGRLFQVTV